MIYQLTKLTEERKSAFTLKLIQRHKKGTKKGLRRTFLRNTDFTGIFSLMPASQDTWMIKMGFIKM